MCNVWPCTNHSIHQAANNWDIRHLTHMVPSFVFSDCSLLSLKLLPNGVLTSLASFMLNLLRIFFTYSTYESFNVPLVLSLMILIPRICFAAPKSFIANCFDICFFILLIFSMLDPTMSISSNTMVKWYKNCQRT